MENNKLNLISKIITGVLAILGVGASLLIFNYVINPETLTTENELRSSKVEIDKDALAEVQSPKVYSTPVSVDEPGFGRANPFLEF